MSYLAQSARYRGSDLLMTCSALSRSTLALAMQMMSKMSPISLFDARRPLGVPFNLARIIVQLTLPVSSESRASIDSGDQ